MSKTRNIFTGLGTLVITLQTTNTFIVQGQLTLPRISAGDTANSSVVVTVLHNASTIYTGSADAQGFTTQMFAATAGDTVSITTSSSATIDKSLNTIKTTVQILGGQI